MSEAKLQEKVLKDLEKLDAIPVENPKKPGTPDINYLDGWIELKWLPKFPKKLTTIVRFPKFTPQQRVWLLKRNMKGGKCFVLAHVDTLYFLFAGVFASKELGRITKIHMLHHALKVWDHYPYSELKDYL